MKIELCQLDYTVGDLKGNTDKIIGIINKYSDEKETTILLFSELAVIGYPPLDLLDNKAFIQDQNEYINKIIDASVDNECLIVIGYAEENAGVGRDLFNSALVIHDGKKIYNYRKRLLPTYDVFDEARYFEPGKEMGLFNFKEKRIGIVICEDLWFTNKFYSINPAQELFNARADMILSLNASPSIVGKYDQKLNMVKAISKKYALPICYCNQTGGNDDIVFDGNSFIINERGVLVREAPRFEEYTLSVPIEALQAHCQGFSMGIQSRRYESDAEFYYEQAVCGIRSYIKKCGFKGVVIGESGGIDSAVVTALAADALGSKNVVGITMPSQYSSEGSYKDSEILCSNFGAKFHTFPIKDIFETILTPFDREFGSVEKMGLMEENLQARIRGQVLMAYSNRYGYMVLSTGNKSEMSVGYFTIYGDACGGMAPISDLYKMEVYALARYINSYHGKEMIPQAIIDKAPSAELAPDQKDTDSLPSYPILDAILRHLIEGKELIIPGVPGGVDTEDITKVKILIKRAEFKRRQAAITIKMHDKAFGYGRRIPIAQKWDMTK